MGKVLKTIVQLRRDNSYNYDKIKDSFIPMNGEVVLVDTSDKGLRAKIGDGVKTYAQLGFADESIYAQINKVVAKGYYYNNAFYVDSSYTEEMDTDFDLYIDKTSSKIYVYDGVKYVGIIDTLPNASATVSGIMKLYDELGNNVDGTITQKRLTEEFGRKFHVDVASDDECIVFSI